MGGFGTNVSFISDMKSLNVLSVLPGNYKKQA